jgi:hypothetical protein
MVLDTVMAMLKPAVNSQLSANGEEGDLRTGGATHRQTSWHTGCLVSGSTS